MLAKELKEYKALIQENQEINKQIKLQDGTITANEFVELDALDMFSISKNITKYETQNGNVYFERLNPEDETDVAVAKAYAQTTGRTDSEIWKVKLQETANERTIIIKESNASVENSRTIALFLKWLVWDNKTASWTEATRELNWKIENKIELPEYVGYFNVIGAWLYNTAETLKKYKDCPIFPNKMIIKDGCVLVNKLAEGNEDGHKIKIVQKASNLTTSRGKRRN